MNPVERFEGFIERLMERMFTRAAGSSLQPVEIGKKLVRCMESAEQSVGVDGVPRVPNVYHVYLSPTDYAHFESVQRSLSRDLETRLAREARQRGLRMVSRPAVLLHRDPDLAVGTVQVEPEARDVEGPPREDMQHTAFLPRIDESLSEIRATPNIRLNGDSHAVLRSPTKLGRLPENDIVIDDPRVSRRHAELTEKGGRWLVRDMGSKNGTALNGKLVQEAVLKPGDTISLGGLEVTWEQ